MNKKELCALLKHKFLSLAAVVAAAFVIAAAMFALYEIVLRLLPAPVLSQWRGTAARLFRDPALVRE